MKTKSLWTVILTALLCSCASTRYDAQGNGTLAQ